MNGCLKCQRTCFGSILDMLLRPCQTTLSMRRWMICNADPVSFTDTHTHQRPMLSAAESQSEGHTQCYYSWEPPYLLLSTSSPLSVKYLSFNSLRGDWEKGENGGCVRLKRDSQRHNRGSTRALSDVSTLTGNHLCFSLLSQFLWASLSTV